jgi:outer membrane lipoprotein SlyB
MTATPAKSNPIFVIAAIAVIIFSGVGVAMMTGLIPSSASKSNSPESEAQATASADKSTDKSTKSSAKEKHDATAKKEHAKPEHVACANCGEVESVHLIEKKGEGSGLGVIAGGVTGALLGNQVGQGNGKTVATIAGAAGGAFAGNEIEKNVKKTKHYKITVRMADGSTKSVNQSADPGLLPGDKVKIVDNAVVRRE